MHNELVCFSDLAQFREQFDIGDDFLELGYKRIISGDNVAEAEQLMYFQVLYIDGITSSGKSTLLDLLQKEIPDAHFIPEAIDTIPFPHRNVNPSRPIVDQLRAEFWFYNQYIKKDEEIRQYTGKVIVDRGLLGLFCYSNLLSDQNEVSLRIMRRASQRQWAPGLYIFLTARPEVIRERLLTRNDTARIREEDWINSVGSYIELLHKSVKNVASQAGVYLLDTSEKSPHEVMLEVKNLFNAYCEN